jgi:hypothetical protein
MAVKRWIRDPLSVAFFVPDSYSRVEHPSRVQEVTLDTLRHGQARSASAWIIDADAVVSCAAQAHMATCAVRSLYG